MLEVQSLQHAAHTGNLDEDSSEPAGMGQSPPAPLTHIHVFGPLTELGSGAI